MKVVEVYVKVKRIRYFGTCLDLDQGGSDTEQAEDPNELHPLDTGETEEEDMLDTWQETTGVQNQILGGETKLKHFVVVRDCEGFLDMKKLTEVLVDIETVTTYKDILIEKVG